MLQKSRVFINSIFIIAELKNKSRFRGSFMLPKLYTALPEKTASGSINKQTLSSAVI
jgi:hypothetical protein